MERPMDPQFLLALAGQRKVVPFVKPAHLDLPEIDSLTFAAMRIEEHLSDCLAAAHLTNDVPEIARIAGIVNDVVVNASAIHHAIIDRENRLTAKPATCLVSAADHAQYWGERK